MTSRVTLLINYSSIWNFLAYLEEVDEDRVAVHLVPADQSLDVGFELALPLLNIRGLLDLEKSLSGEAWKIPEGLEKLFVEFGKFVESLAHFPGVAIAVCFYFVEGLLVALDELLFVASDPDLDCSLLHCWLLLDAFFKDFGI